MAGRLVQIPAQGAATPNPILGDVMFYDEKKRGGACVHDATHAVIAALGAAGVYEIAVAPVPASREGQESNKPIPLQSYMA